MASAVESTTTATPSASSRRVAKLAKHAAGGSVAAAPTAAATKFRYTVDLTCKGILTDEERRAYERDGFLVRKGLVPKDALEVYRRRFEAICADEVDRPAMLQIIRDVALRKETVRSGDKVTKLQSFEDDEVLFEYCTRPEILRYVQCFTGLNVKSCHTMLINKPPDPGHKTSRHPLHQDLHYFPFRPADRIVASWTAMQRVTRANGCLVVIPGSHHEGELLPHGYPKWANGVNKAYHGITTFEEAWVKKLVYLEMEPGDTVFFHPLLIHGSGSNQTKGFRKAISCHYASSSCYYVDVRGTSQENVATEVERIAKKRGVDIDYIDIWKYKSRLVQGLAGTL